jgi:hypothetical protein
VCYECVLRGLAGRRGQNAVIVVSSPVGNSSRRNGGSIGVIGVARHLDMGSSEQCLYRSGFSGPDAGRAMSREGRKTAGDGIDNPYRVEERLGAEPQVAAAAQRQPGARVDKPFRLGADGGRGHPGMRADRAGPSPPNRQLTDPSPPGGRWPKGGTNLEYGASAVFPCGVIPATDRQGRVPAFGRLTNYGSHIIRARSKVTTLDPRGRRSVRERGRSD